MEDISKPTGAALIGVQPEQVTQKSMLSAAQQAFCEGVARGLNGTRAYGEAYPLSSYRNAGGHASHLLRMPEVRAEIARLRGVADYAPGSAVLGCVEKRRFLARVVRANLADFDPAIDGDLLQVCEADQGKLRLRLFDKIRAIELDNDLAGEGSEAEVLDELGEMLRGIMMENVPGRGGGARPDRPPAVILSGPQRKFCEGIVRGEDAIMAYRAAYSRATDHSVNSSAYRMLKMEPVKAEIARLKAAAEKLAGSEAMDREEKQRFLARLLRANLTSLDTVLDGDLLQGYELNKGKLRLRLADKLRAIAVDDDLADKGTQAGANADFEAWAARVRKG